jgi:nitroreductase
MFCENLNVKTDKKVELPSVMEGTWRFKNREGTVLDVIEAIKERRSVRAYTGEDVSDKHVEMLINAARWAPSAGNGQPWAFVVVKDAETKRKLMYAAQNQTWLQKASVVIVVCADLKQANRVYGSRGETLYSIQDTAAATENILLVAKEMGLATCWVGAFQETDVAEIVKAPKNVRPVAMVAVGHPAEKPSARQRRPVDEIVHYGTF